MAPSEFGRGNAHRVVVVRVRTGSEHGGHELRRGVLREVRLAGAMLEGLVEKDTPAVGDAIALAFHGTQFTRDRRRQYGLWAFHIVDRGGRKDS